MFSLFQIMTLEGWADIARTLMDKYPCLISILFLLYSLLHIQHLTFLLRLSYTMSEIHRNHAQETGKIEDIIQDEMRNSETI